MGQLHLRDDWLVIRVLVVLLRVKTVISLVLESQRETEVVILDHIFGSSWKRRKALLGYLLDVQFSRVCCRWGMIYSNHKAAIRLL